MTGSSKSIQVGEDSEFKRRSWRAQRIGWVIMTLVLVAGALGFLGGAGPFVRTVTTAPNASTRVEYPRFIRVRSPIDDHVIVNSQTGSNDEIEVAVDRTYLQQFEIRNIVPAPSSEAVSESSITYFFQVDRNIPEFIFTFNLEAEYAGIGRGSITVADEQPLEFWQMVYP